jgi:methylphosphotriester-DNA--protein-cysteine methyltransferase
MIHHNQIQQSTLIQQIKAGKILYGGNKNLKIYGQLTCKSGKLMKRENRVFFASEQEAISQGFRPCGHCLRAKYIVWNTNFLTTQGGR